VCRAVAEALQQRADRWDLLLQSARGNPQRLRYESLAEECRALARALRHDALEANGTIGGPK
jgi:long-subunit acyl-CoA synthetase (AMP-forming)